MTILETVFPIFAIVLIGYLLARRGMFDQRDVAGISRYVFNIGLPLLLFDSLSTVTLPERIEWGFLLAYYGSALTVYGLAMVVGRWRFRQSQRRQGIFGLGASYSNTVLIGLPVIFAAFGDAGMLPMLLLISVHSPLMFFIVTLIEETDGQNEGSAVRIAAQALKQIVTNPIIVGLVLGLTVNLLGITVPGPLADTIELLGRSGLPVALFVLGATLSTYKLAGQFAEAWTMTGLKLVVHPLLVWLLAFHLFDVDPLWGAVAVVTAGLPVGVNVYLFAQRYQEGIATTATAVVISTTLAVGSVTALLALFL